MDSNRVLGKGLSALIPGAGSKNYWGPTVRTVTDTESIVQLGVDAIRANPWQPRKSFDQEKLRELAASIKEHGIIQPLVVTKEGGEYQLVAGERRLRAAQQLGMKTVPAVVREIEEQKKLEVSLIENLQRHNLNPLEEALGYKRLMDEFNLTQEEVGARVGKARTSVTNLLRLLGLPKPALEALVEEKISVSHAKEILSYDTEAERLEALERILHEGLTVEQIKRPVRRTRHPVGDPVLTAWEERLSSHVGFRAAIKKKRRGGVIEIAYNSEEDLKSLLDRLLGGGAASEREIQ